MLYIPVEVNGHHIKAFVDSGAQATIMSPACAEKCNVMRLLDTRFSGIARGVGTAKILGRVHSAQIKIGPSYHPCSFTVMEGKDVDLLLGLDMLKRHQACIDLQKGVLKIVDNEVPFLSEAEIPKDGLGAEEPVVSGPAGMQVGGRSGAIMAPHGEEGQQAGPSSTSKQVASQPSQVQQSTPAPNTGRRGFPREDIERLVALGFSAEEAVQALSLANGNVELAAGMLM